MRQGDTLGRTGRAQHLLVLQLPALIALAYISLLSLGLIDNIRGPFYPEVLADLGLSGTKGSAFFAVTSLVATAGSFLSQPLLARVSAPRVLLLASVIFGVGFACVSRADSFWTLVLSCALFGAGFGVMNVTQNVLICEHAPVAWRRRLLNGLHAMYGLSALVAPLAASATRAAGGTWRDGFLLAAVLPLLVSGWGFIQFRGQSEVRAEAAQPHARWTFTERRARWGFTLLMALYLWGELSISTRMVLWLRAERGYAPDAADLLLALFFATLLGGRVLFGVLHLRAWSSRAILIASALVSAVVYACALLIEPMLLMLCGLTLAPFYPVAMDLISERFGPRSAPALARIIGGGNLSLVGMHVALGWLGDWRGITFALGSGSLALLFIALGLAFTHLRERRPLTG